MNKRMTLHVLGEVLLVQALLLLLPALTALIYAESIIKFYLLTSLMCALAGVLLLSVPVHDRRIRYKDGFVIVCFGWILLSLFGALPFFLSGEIPSYIDALFESVSGYTTTGSTVLTDVEELSRASLFHRSFSHWVGGMGVLAFLMVLVPVAQGGSNLNLMRAESPGVEVEKLVPKSNRTARILYGIYFSLTLLQLSLMLAGGMPIFDAVTITFGTAGTGGFSILNSGLASYSVYIQTVVTVFMVLFGINFNLYFLIICRRLRDALKSEELRVYLIIFATASLIISFDVFSHSLYPTFLQSLHQAAFHTSSVMSTTGYATSDFNLWSEVSRAVLMAVMCIGSCAGSTAGGLKVSRLIIALKSASCEIRQVISQRSVAVVKYDGKRVKDSVVKTTYAYILIYILIIALSFLIVSFDGNDFLTDFSAVLTAVNNVGPGFGKVGPYGNFSSFSSLSKLVFICDMLLGRLEIFPVLVALSALFGKKNRSL